MPPVSRETLLRYCETVFDALSANATEDGELRVWEGRYVELFSGLGISNAHYSRISSTLQEIGSIEIVRRGARGVSTRIVLHRRPEQADLDGSVGLDSPLTRPTAADKLTQRVTQLERRLDGIELKTYLANLEKRLRVVEGKVGKQEKS